MYQSKHYTCEEIDERLLKGYYDDAVSKGYSDTFEQFQTELASIKDIAKNKESIQANASAINTNAQEITDEIARAQAAEQANAKSIAGVAKITGNLSKLNTSEKTSIVKAINEIVPHTTIEDGFYICDLDGKVLIRLDVLDSKNGLGENLMNYIISQIPIPISPDSIIKYTDKDGFYICNEYGEVIAIFKDDQWTFLNAESELKTGVVTKKGNVTSGDTWNITRNSVKHGQRLIFSGEISNFSTIIIGHGNMSNHEASWVEVDDTNLYVHYHNSGDSEQSGYPMTYPHGLTIANNIQIEVVQKNAYTAKVRITSNGSVYETSTEITWFGSSGNVYMSSTSILTDCSFGWTSSQIDSGVWLFGDSYFSLTNGGRWTSYLFTNEHTNFMLNGYPGEGSASALADLQNLLAISTPKVIVWCMGMNDPDSASDVNPKWKTVVDSVKEICKQNNIELILSTIPTVVGGWNQDTQSNNLGIHKFKNAIVRSSGIRYIDFDKAVGANENTGEWYNNGLSNDMLEYYGQQKGRIHPTVFGAKALYAQAVADCPELVK